MRSDVALWADALEAEDFLTPAEILPEAGGARGPVVFGDGTLLGIFVYLALNADLTADPSTWALTQIPSELVRYESGITVRSGRTSENDTVAAGEGSLVLDNRDGRFTRRNPLSPYYPYLTRNTPIFVDVNAGNGAYPFLRQYVSEYVPGWDKSGNDAVMTIKSGGPLRRLGQNNPPLRSAAYRAIITDPDLVQYWSCEDDSDSTSLASAVGVGTALFMIGTVTPAASTVTTGTEALPTLGTGTSYVRGDTGMANAGTSTAWTYFGTYYFTSVPVFTAGDGLSYLLYIPTSPTGSLTRWLVYWNDSDNTVYLEVRSVSAVVTTVAGPVLTNAEMINCFLTFWVSASQSGSNVAYAFGVERTTTTTTASQSASGTINTQTVRQVTQMLAFNGKSAADTVVGHLAVLDRALASTDNTPCYGAFNGYIGETALERITRLCSEENVPLTMLPETAPSTTMGPQTTSSFLDNLKDAESVDGGALYEDGFGLGYQPLSARYNQNPALRLSYTGNDLGDIPQIPDDDLYLRNQWTIARTDGSSGTYSDAVSIARDDLHADSETLQLESDDQPIQVAAWRTHLGTNDDPRWATLRLRLDSAAGRALIPAWTQVGFGDVITISDVPDYVAGAIGDEEMVLEGASQRVDQFTWTVDAATSPGRVYHVFELESLAYGALETDGSTITVAIDSDDTSLTVATTDTTSPVWTQDTTDMPFDIEIGGERMRVTAVSGATSPQTFTVTRSVNGIVKSHAVGASVTMWDGGVLAK